MAQLEFRDGTREVPDHLADLMYGIDHRRLTYDQAIVAVNRKLLSDHTGEQINKLIGDHFKTFGGRP